LKHLEFRWKGPVFWEESVFRILACRACGANLELGNGMPIPDLPIPDFPDFSGIGNLSVSMPSGIGLRDGVGVWGLLGQLLRIHSGQGLW
jgi:hypothetical protein